MGVVIIEQSSDSELPSAGLGWDQHEVRAVLTSRNQRYRVTVLETVDEAEVRQSLIGRGVPFDQIWSAEPLEIPEPEQTPAEYELVVVQRKLPQVLSKEMVMYKFQQDYGCLKRHLTTAVFSFLAGDGLRMVCGFRAPDAGAVRSSQKMTGAPVLRAWSAREAQHAPS